MKKILSIVIVIILLIAVSSGPVAIAQTESQQEHHDYTVLPVPLIGTWRRIDSHQFHVFYEDGTVLIGSSRIAFPRPLHKWYIVGDQLRTDRSETYSFEDGVLVVSSTPGPFARTYRYVFYSEATNLYEGTSPLLQTLVGFILFTVLGVLPIALVVRKIWKKVKSKIKHA